MASKKVNIGIDTTADTSGAKQATAAMGQLEAATNSASTATRNAGNVTLQAGYQIQDFATQIAAGTSAFTAFAQNAPQFLGAFGPKGAVVGALVAVGAVVAKVAYEIVTGAGDAEAALEKTIKATEELQDKLLKAYEAQAGEKAQAAIAAIERQSTLTNILREGQLDLVDVQKTRIQKEADLAKSQDDLTTKAITYLGQIGQIKDVEAGLNVIRQQAQDREKGAAIATIEAGVESAKARYNNIKAQKDDLDVEVKNAESRIASLQEQQQKLTSKLNLARRTDERKIELGLEEEGYKSSAVATLEAKFSGLEKEISSLFKFIDTAPDRINKLTEQSFTQAAKLEEVMAKAQIDIEGIESKYQLTEKAEAITTASQAIGATAKAITEGIGQFEAIGQVQEEAKSQLLQMASDGKITADEQVKAGALLQTLTGTLKSTQSEHVSRLNELITINNDLASKLIQADGAIQNLRTRVNNIFIQTR